MDAIQEQVVIASDGVLELHSSQLRAGDKVMVVITPVPMPADNEGKPKRSWRDFIGALGPGDHGSSDNESIDRDLAASYADNHEPEK